MRYLLYLILLLSLTSHAQKRVVVIGLDGLSPDGIQKAPTPVLDSLMKQGSYSMNAKAVYPSSSSPNWASMITGTSPAHHEIWSNDWKRVDIADKVVLRWCQRATVPHDIPGRAGAKQKCHHRLLL